MKLKYGMNPNQAFAEIEDNTAFSVLNGNPSFINILDGLNAWQLVREIKISLGKTAAASFKHVTPSGVALGENPPSIKEKAAYWVENEIQSEAAAAYLRARGSDRLASFGDFIAFNTKVDSETAEIIRAEVSDGIIAPAYDPEALEILKSKKKGGYVIFRMDPDYEPAAIEERQVFGIRMRQDRNSLPIDASLLKNAVTKNSTAPDKIMQDLVLGMITLKYTQSNSICLVKDGQVIGIGSGQQSRILCSELAASKAEVWFQKQNIDYGLPLFNQKTSRTEKDQLAEQYRQNHVAELGTLGDLGNICLCSDGFFPQTDNIELARKKGVRYIASPMGSIKDDEIIRVCDQYGMVFFNTGVRLFHHG